MPKLQHFKNQKYKKLKKLSMESGAPFQDPLFTPSNCSLGLDLPGEVVWKRPTELSKSPHLFVEKASSKDVTQGSVGNCWFVAACSALATVKRLWSVVVPEWEEQEWADPNQQHPGIFRFRFWRFGAWIEVVVDDYLPTINGSLIFCHSTAEDEFWSALLEKAYAKLCGSYGALDGGNLCDALVDFTSGISENVEMGCFGTDQGKKEGLRMELLRKHEERALMCCAINPSNAGEFEARTRTGLVMGHAYGITSIRELSVGASGLLSQLFSTGEGKKLTLLRLRNPWGQKEWNGAFSDGSASSFAYSVEQCLRLHSSSPEWTSITNSEKEKLGLTFEEDGEFWIPFDDFVSEFTHLSICHLPHTSLLSFWKKRWRESTVFGEWSLPDNAGGCPNHPDTFTQNPQYIFDLARDDSELIVHLIQKDKRGSNSPIYDSIGMHIMKVEENRATRVHKGHTPLATSDYVKGRSVVYKGRFGAGRHLLLPTTFTPGIETQFMLRIYSECGIRLRELKEEVPGGPPTFFPCCAAPPCGLTVVRVEGPVGLGKLNTYCVIRVEGESLRSRIGRGSGKWELEGIFFRYDASLSVQVEVWESRLGFDRFLGCGVVETDFDGAQGELKKVALGSGGRARGRACLATEESYTGELYIWVDNYEDLDST